MSPFHSMKVLRSTLSPHPMLQPHFFVLFYQFITFSSTSNVGLCDFGRASEADACFFSFLKALHVLHTVECLEPLGHAFLCSVHAANVVHSEEYVIRMHNAESVMIEEGACTARLLIGTFNKSR